MNGISQTVLKGRQSLLYCLPELDGHTCPSPCPSPCPNPFLTFKRYITYKSYSTTDSGDYLDGKIGQRTFSVYKVINRRPSASPFPKPETEKSENFDKNEKTPKKEIPKSNEPDEKSKSEMAVDDLVPKDTGSSPETMMQNIPIRSRY